MNALSNRTYQSPHTLYESDYIGRELYIVEDIGEENVVKDFKIGGTHIKICDDYCRDKTPEAVQNILDRIAYKTQVQLSMQSGISQSDIE